MGKQPLQGTEPALDPITPATPEKPVTSDPERAKIPESLRQGLTGSELNIRLGVSKRNNVLAKKRDAGPDALAGYTREKDPDGLSWRFDGSQGRYGKYFPIA